MNIKNLFRNNNKVHKLILAIMLLVFCFTLVPVLAAEKSNANVSGKKLIASNAKPGKCYKILSGKEKIMCRLFQENLNHFCKKTSMVCEPPIHPDFAKYFTVPKWETVDYKSHLDVIEQYIKIRAIIPINCSGKCVTNVRENKWQEYKQELLKRLESGKLKLVCASIQIKYDYDNKSKSAYKLVDTVCSTDDPKNYEISRRPGLMIIDEDTGKPNEYYSKTPILLGHNDIIVYQGDAYLLGLDHSLYFPDLYSRNKIECNYQYINYQYNFGSNKGGKK